MHKHTIHGLILFLAASSAAWATPVINVGTHYLLPNDVRTIQIAVSGGDLVEGLNFFVQVADGGAINDGSATKPKITGIDIIGQDTLFSQSNRGSSPTHLPGAGGTYLIWSDLTVTLPGDTLSASGPLAYVTIDTAGAPLTNPPDPLAYALNLANVAAGYLDPDPAFNTDFGDVTPTINAGWIVISNLRDLTWNELNNGNWTVTTWDGALPDYPTCPNYTSRVIVDASYTVDIASDQEANSLALSGGGEVTIGTDGSLSLTTDATIASGSNLQVEGVLNVQDITLEGSLNLTAGGSAQVANISGAGELVVGDNTTSSILSADSIRIGSLTIGAGSKVVIAPRTGVGPMSGMTSITPVPEPSTVSLLIAAALGILFYCKKIR